MKLKSAKGMTLIELMVVVIILGILSSIAVNVYLQRVVLAKIAAARATIQSLETAIAAYQTDVGQLPPSGSGTNFAPNSPNPTSPAAGCGYMFLVLTRSYNADMKSPIDSHWRGPYIDIPTKQTGTLTGGAITSSTPEPSIQILDPWGHPYRYVRNEDYSSLGGTVLPSTSPFAGTETYYNANGFQIVSPGPDGLTPDPPDSGTGNDDISNFKN